MMDPIPQQQGQPIPSQTEDLRKGLGMQHLGIREQSMCLILQVEARLSAVEALSQEGHPGVSALVIHRVAQDAQALWPKPDIQALPQGKLHLANFHLLLLEVCPSYQYPVFLSMREVDLSGPVHVQKSKVPGQQRSKDGVS